VLRDQGELPAARDHLEWALAVFEAWLGHNHHLTAEILSNLATVLRDQGELPAARDHLERALAVFEARLGSEHPWTTDARSELATIQTVLEDESG
jgi:hypothetical protein